MQQREADEARHDALDRLSIASSKLIEKILHTAARQQLDGMRPHHFRQVGRERRRGIDHRIARRLGAIAIALFDPARGHSEGGIRRLDARDRLGIVSRRDREGAIRRDVVGRHLLAADPDRITSGPQVEIVADVDQRNDEAELRGELAARRPDA